MVKVEINEHEAKAFADSLKDTKTLPEIGYILVTLRYKIFTAFEKERKKQQKEKSK